MKLEHRTLLINGCDNFEFVAESIRRPRASDQRVGAAVSAGNPRREEYTSCRAFYFLQPKTELDRRSRSCRIERHPETMKINNEETDSHRSSLFFLRFLRG